MTSAPSTMTTDSDGNGLRQRATAPSNLGPTGGRGVFHREGKVVSGGGQGQGQGQGQGDAGR